MTSEMTKILNQKIRKGQSPFEVAEWPPPLDFNTLQMASKEMINLGPCLSDSNGRQLSGGFKKWCLPVVLEAPILSTAAGGRQDDPLRVEQVTEVWRSSVEEWLR